MNVDSQIATAESQVGYHEGPNNDNDFLDWQTDGLWRNSPWCDAFAQWAAVTGGGMGWPEYCQWGPKGDSYCPYTKRHAEMLGLWNGDRNATPARGWQVLFSWGNNGVADHIGTVLRVRSNGDLECIEGNKNDAVTYTLRNRAYVLGFVMLPETAGADVPLWTPPPQPVSAGDNIGKLDWPVLSTRTRRSYPVHTSIVQDCESNAPVDGDYYKATRTGVVNFQRRHGLTIDGSVGAYTGTAIVQVDLAWAGYDVGSVDGDYGPRTTEAVKAFQRDRGLTDDGVFGPQSTQALWDRIQEG